MNNAFYNIILFLSMGSSTLIFVILLVLNAFRKLKHISFIRQIITYLPTFIFWVILLIKVPNSYGEVVIGFKIFSLIMPILFALVGTFTFTANNYHLDENKNIVPNKKD